MCGRYTLIKLASFLDYFSWIEQPGLFPEPQFNIAPSQSVAVVTNGSDPPRIDYLRWGLVPSWSKDGSVTAGSKMINARAETLAGKPAFARLLKRQRCLIPADGFYEWKKRSGDKTKTPFYFQLNNCRPFALAGLYDSWHAPEEGEIRTCTIITTSANALLKSFHDRMPVILKDEHCRRWVSPGELDSGEADEILTAYPADQMMAWPVSTRVNRPGINAPALIDRVEPPAPVQPTLFGD